MNINALARRGKQVFSDNSPAILTITGVAGTVATALLAARAGFRAGYQTALDDATSEADATESKPLVKSERRRKVAKDTWKLYLPSAVTGVGTITAIAAANRIGTNRTAAIAAAYTITDRAFGEYKAKVVETLGEKKEKTEIEDKIMQDRVNATGERAALVVISNNDVLCYDAFSDRYFQSNMENLKKAQNDTNYEIINNLYVSLTEFYSKVGLPPTGFSDDVGWNSDNLLELHFSSVMTPDDRPALAFTFHVEPIRGYSKAHP